jgi:hypothetical protein
LKTGQPATAPGSYATTLASLPIHYQNIFFIFEAIAVR